MNILLIAGLRELKLKSTIEPIANIDSVERIFLVRRNPISYMKTVCISPPQWLRRWKILSEFYRIATVLSLCLTHKIDCVIGIHYIFHGIYVSLVGMIFRKPTVMLIVEDPKKYNKRSLFHFFCRKIQFIGVRGQMSKHYFTRQLGIQESKIFILPDVFHFNRVNENVGIKKEYDIIFIGNIVREKRVDIFLHIIDQIRHQMPLIKAVVLGDGRLKKEIHKLYKNLKLESHVDFVGDIENLHYYLMRSKILMITSETEGLPVVLYEAMACDIPSVVPDVGDITDVAMNDYNAMVVERLNVEQFCTAGHKLLTNQDFYSQLVNNNQIMKEKIQNRYTLEHVTSIWENVFKEI